MEKQIKLSCLLMTLTLLVSTSGCSGVYTDNPDFNIQKIKEIKSKTSLKGFVQFPSTFKTKAIMTDVAVSATISLIYPSDYTTSSLRNVVIASGLTGADGSFSINPSAAFSPATNDVFTMEAIKRLGGAGNDSISLRTLVKWNGTSFNSITTPNLYINTKTTSLSIIASLSPSDVTSAATIGTMSTSGGASVVSTINSTVTATLINSVKTLVETQLTANIDPVSTIEVHSGVYSIHQPVTPNSQTYTTGCVGEASSCP